MYDYTYIDEKLKQMLQKSRYDHVLRVVDCGLKMNEQLRLNLPIDKVKLGCYLHDCAKNNEKLYFEKYKQKYNLDESIKKPSYILHAKLAPIVAKEEYGIKDQDILDALRWHTTGKANMNLLEKVVFLADAIEAKRDYPLVNTIRELAKKNLDLACLTYMNDTIKYLVDSGTFIDIMTIEARNYLQGEINGER